MTEQENVRLEHLAAELEGFATGGRRGPPALRACRHELRRRPGSPRRAPPYTFASPTRATHLCGRGSLARRSMIARTLC